MLRQLRGEVVKLGGAQQREHCGDQGRELRLGELRQPAPDGLQPPLEVLRLKPGTLGAGLKLGPPVEDCLFVFSWQ